jgi:hypothetical protein
MRFEKLSTLCEEITTLQARVQDAAREEFKPALKEVITILREEVPSVTKLRWNQFIPGFNDGEPCDFTMGEVTYFFKDPSLSKEGDYENGFIESSFNKESLGKASKGYQPYGLTQVVDKGLLTIPEAELLSSLADDISRLESASELAFGPDVQITLNIETGEVELEEYECGY